MARGQQSNTLASGWATLALADGGIDPRDPAVGHGTERASTTSCSTIGSETGAGAIERTALAVGTVSNEWAQFLHLHRELPRLVESERISRAARPT